jgi:WS/DGAT/MGAT family acyltransferase
MPRHNYERLSAQDTSFLVFESPVAFTHAGGTSIFDAGPLETGNGGLDIATIHRSIESLLHRVPRFRQRLEWIPVEQHPVWVDDSAFDLDYHLRHIRLPHPGTEEDLKELSARVLAHRMDLTKPPWETWIVEGLEGGRWAMIQKLHHCMIDGKAGVDLAQLMLSPEPEVELVDPTPYIPRPAPTRGELFRDSLGRRLRMPLDAIRYTRETYEDLRELTEDVKFRGRAVGRMARSMLRAAPDTPLNGKIGPHRRVDWLDFSLDRVKALSKALGGTVNDVVLATVTGAVRRFVEHRSVDPASLEGFRCAAPVSTRPKSAEGKLGNHVSMWLLDLPIDEADPVARFEKVRTQTADLKESQQAVGADVLFQVVEWTGTRILSLASQRLSASTSPYNLMVTNVPGPQMPLYLCGGLLRSTYAYVPLVENTVLGIALFSYNGTISWGFNCDYERMPDLADFVAAIDASFKELQRAARLKPKTARKKSSRRQKAS